MHTGCVYTGRFNSLGVTSAIKGETGFITLTSGSGNTLTKEALEDLYECVFSITGKPGIKGAVISGEGRHFSSGADIEQLKEIFLSDKGSQRGFLEGNMRLLQEIEESSVTFTAAVNGCCLGLGLELALACDYIIAGKNTVFSFPETGYSLIPGCGGTIRLQERTGKAFAVDMIISSRMVSAEEGYRVGLVDHLCDKREIITKAQRLALLENPIRVRE